MSGRWSNETSKSFLRSIATGWTTWLMVLTGVARRVTSTIAGLWVVFLIRSSISSGIVAE